MIAKIICILLATPETTTTSSIFFSTATMNVTIVIMIFYTAIIRNLSIGIVIISTSSSAFHFTIEKRPTQRINGEDESMKRKSKCEMNRIHQFDDYQCYILLLMVLHSLSWTVKRALSWFSSAVRTIRRRIVGTRAATYKSKIITPMRFSREWCEMKRGKNTEKNQMRVEFCIICFNGYWFGHSSKRKRVVIKRF